MSELTNTTLQDKARIVVEYVKQGIKKYNYRATTCRHLSSVLHNYNSIREDQHNFIQHIYELYNKALEINCLTSVSEFESLKGVLIAEAIPELCQALLVYRQRHLYNYTKTISTRLLKRNPDQHNRDNAFILGVAEWLLDKDYERAVLFCIDNRHRLSEAVYWNVVKALCVVVCDNEPASTQWLFRSTGFINRTHFTTSYAELALRRAINNDGKLVIYKHMTKNRAVCIWNTSLEHEARLGNNIYYHTITKDDIFGAFQLNGSLYVVLCEAINNNKDMLSAEVLEQWRREQYKEKFEGILRQKK